MTNVTTKTALFGVDDLKIYPITTDAENEFSVAEAIDLPGVRQISLTLEIDEKELTGDEKTLAVSSKIKSVTFNSEYAKLSLDVLKVLTSGNVTEGEDKTSFELGDKGKPQYFQLQAQIKGVDDIKGGDAHITIYKAKATALPINGVQDDYATYTFDGKGVFTECKWGEANEAKLLKIDFNKATKDVEAVTYKAAV